MEHEYINKVAGPEKQFIMPLIFPADEQLERLGTGQGKGKRKADKDRDVEHIGHLMLAVAHSERTKEIVENSEWAAPDDQGAHIPIANNTYVRTPKQKANSNTCGFYTILNAWAVMLGIPVHPQSRRRGQSTHGEFMAQGLEMINLALSGHMDSRTIQAFLNVFGYTTVQDPENENDNVKHRVTTVRMNQGRLEIALNNQRCLDENIPPASATPSDESPSLTTTTFPDGDIQQLLALGGTAEQAIEALRRSHGDVDAAGARLFDMLPTSPTMGEFPDSSGNLSPSTNEDQSE